MNNPKPYRVAEIAYDPCNPDFPWYVRRSGTIAEQGGLGWGYESLSFETIEDACEDLAQMIAQDQDRIKADIEKRELSGETG
jgi:hypothetical protein